MGRRRSLFSLLLCAFLPAAILWPATAAGNGGRYSFALFGPDQGLPHGTVLSITQDRDGFIWLGSENGLIRLEGRQHRRWTKQDGLLSSWVQRVLADPDGGTWIGTIKGLMHFRDGRFRTAVFNDRPSTGSISHLAIDGHGRLWVVSGQSVFRQEQGIRFKTFQRPGLPAVSFMSSGNRSGTVYLASAGGVEAYDGEKLLQRWRQADGLPDETALVIEDGQGRLWVGNSGRLVVRQAGGAVFSDRSALLPAAISPNSYPFYDRDGSIWIPTQNGALHLSADRSERLDSSRGLPFRWTRTLFRDRDGNLWLIGPALARRLGDGRLLNYSLSADSFGQVVWRIVMDPHTGTPLLGTDDGALRLNPSGPQAIAGSQGHRIKDLLFDRSGKIWMVGTTGPTLWLSPGQSRAVIAPLGRFGTQIHSVFQDSRSTIWLGHTRQGLLRWDDRGQTLVQELRPQTLKLSSLGVYAVREDPSLRLWAASDAGLLIRSPNGRWARYSEADGLKSPIVRGLAFLADGRCWLFYQEALGLTQVRLDADRLAVLKSCTSQDGLTSDAVYSLAVDDRQQVWVGTDKGVCCLGKPLRIGRNQGMASEDCALGALLVDRQQVWIGTANGLVAYDSGGAERPDSIPDVHLMDIQYGAHWLEPPFPSLEPLQAGLSTIQFRMALPRYHDYDSFHLRVRLSGLERKWRDTPSFIIRYPNLPGGRYRFEFQAVNSSGKSGPIGGFDFAVRPPWQRSWWAYAGFIALGLLAVSWLVRLRVASLARRQTELEAVIAERTMALNSRNQELSAAMANIRQLSGLLPICSHCKKIRDDKGYWNNLETYISSHSNADFTHSICPSCMKELYPDFMNDEPDS